MSHLAGQRVTALWRKFNLFDMFDNSVYTAGLEQYHQSCAIIPRGLADFYSISRV